MQRVPRKLRHLGRLALALLAVLVWLLPRAPGYAPPRALAAVPVTAEVEPNDTPGTATVLDLAGGYAIATGSIGVAGDVDYYRFAVPAGARLWASTDTGGTATGTSRDTVLDLLAPDGATVVETDDDDGTGNGCDGTVESALASVIAGRPLLTAGNYYLRLKAF